MALAVFVKGTGMRCRRNKLNLIEAKKIDCLWVADWVWPMNKLCDVSKILDHIK